MPDQSEFFQQSEVVRDSKPSIGRIEQVPLREVWPHEATDFTRWLAENPDALSQATGLDLSTVEREQSTGNFSIDLVAERADGGRVVIENQLGKSDHDHLGKLITYLAAVPEAKTAIWITSDPRPEHVEAITWLNESAASDLYLLKIAAVRIGDSPPAPLLTLIVGPSEETRAVAAASAEWGKREQLRYRFWETLLDRARAVTSVHSAISPNQHNWLGAGAGRTGVSFNYSLRRFDGSVELYIDVRDQDANEQIFQALGAHREEIETAFGGPLDWVSREDRRFRSIKFLTEGGWSSDEEDWPSIQDGMIEAMDRLSKALKPWIDRLPRA